MKTSTPQLISLVYFLFLTSSFYSQSTTIDSLEIELRNHQEKDTIRVHLLNNLAHSHYATDLDKAIAYLEESTVLSKSLSFKKGEALILYIKGLIQSSQSDYDQAIGFFDKARSIYEDLGFEKGVSECYAYMGLAFYNNFDYDRSILYYKKSLAIDKGIGQTSATAVSLKYIGFCYTDKGDYERAEQYLNYALDLNIEYNNNLERASCLKNIGSLYLKKGNYPLALEYYNKSLSIYKILKDTAGIATIYNNTGIIHKNYKDYDKAIENYNQSLKIEKKRGNIKNWAITLNNIGVVYIRKGDYKNALTFLKDAIELSKSINDKDNIARCLINTGDVYLGLKNNTVALQNFLEAKAINIEIGTQLGLCYSYLGIATAYTNEKEYDEALINALKSKKISNKLGVLDYQRDVYKLLSTIYENTNKFKKAFESHQQFKIFNDSLFNKENIEKIAQLENEYKYKRALDSASIRELQLTRTVTATNRDLEKSKRNSLWAVIGVLLVSMLSGSIIFYQKFNNIKTKNENIVMEQKLLRSQMTPHFIFNSLSVLQGMILNKEDKKSVSYLSKFSKLLRITLENSRDKTVLLSKEITALENYLALQNLENETYIYKINVDSTIDTSSLKIPPMLIQPFVENAIEHAFTSTKGDKKIEVHLERNNEKLFCTITDNGIGIDSQEEMKTKDKNSLATTITSERLEILSQDLKMKGSVIVEDRKKYNELGTLVTLLIPYKTVA